MRYAPPSASVRWYIFPETVYSNSTRYEIARGQVPHLSIRRPPTIEPPPSAPGIDGEEPVQAAEQQSAPAPVPLLTDNDRKALAGIAGALWVLACAVVVYVGVSLWRKGY